jgi:hypothetical protein
MVARMILMGSGQKLALTAMSVRFLAFIFLMTLRTWTLTVPSHMFNLRAMILLGLACWIARMTASSRAVTAGNLGEKRDAPASGRPVANKESNGT